MTKKHFVDMATEFGLMYRELDGDPYPFDASASVAMKETIRKAEKAFCGVAKRANPRFDKDDFLLFVQEVRSGERDLDGRKVK